MGGRPARDKGARGEAEARDIINESLSTDFCRSPRSGAWQHARGDLFDKINLLRLSIEIKRQETTKIDEWFAQSQAQCPEGDTPTLIYRRSRKPWKSVTLLSDWLELQQIKLIHMKMLELYREGRSEELLSLLDTAWADINR